jgi:hypothetical protein
MERLDDEDPSAFADLRGTKKNEGILALSSYKISILRALQQRVPRLSLGAWAHGCG